MENVILIIGIAIVLEGVGLAVWPGFFKKVIEFFIKGKIIYSAAMLRILLGIVFLVAAQSCGHPWIVIALGIILLGAGAGMFAIKLEKLKSFVGFWAKQSLLTLRFLSIWAFLIGALVIYAAWKVEIAS